MDHPYFLIYASTAARAFTQHELIVLLDLCRETNRRNQVTGILLYSPGKAGEKGTFVQALEGPRVAVEALYRTILADERHTDGTILEQGPFFKRRCGAWTMGFRDLSEVKPEEIPGFSAVFFQNWTLSRVLAEPDPVLRALYSFAGV